MMGLTQPQADTVAAIRRLTAQGGVPPSYEELGAALGITSKSAVSRRLTQLRERGVLEFTNRSRSMRLLGEMEGLERRSGADLRALRSRIDSILRARAQ